MASGALQNFRIKRFLGQKAVKGLGLVGLGAWDLAFSV